jgi:osmotically-inducible protein OsmY
MKNKYYVGMAALAALTVVGWGQSQSGTGSYDKDNTGVNKRDRSSAAVTPESQSMTRSDTELTREIRKNIMKDDSLSTNAQNVKVISRNGTVVLRGTVDTLAEKQRVEQSARQVAGAATVQNELEVKEARTDGGK